MSAPLAVRVGVPVVALGGALGALLRWTVTELAPATYPDFPWTTFGINVAGSALLATLPAVPAVRTRAWLAVFLGTGVLGGFTTMSAASAESVALLEGGRPLTALLYGAGTLVAALVAVILVGRLSTPGQRAEVEAEEADD